MEDLIIVYRRPLPAQIWRCIETANRLKYEWESAVLSWETSETACLTNRCSCPLEGRLDRRMQFRILCGAGLMRRGN
jgi:hypothetical protein